MSYVSTQLALSENVLSQQENLVGLHELSAATRLWNGRRLMDTSYANAHHVKLVAFLREARALEEPALL